MDRTMVSGTIDWGSTPYGPANFFWLPRVNEHSHHTPLFSEPSPPAELPRPCPLAFSTLRNTHLEKITHFVADVPLANRYQQDSPQKKSYGKHRQY